MSKAEARRGRKWENLLSPPSDSWGLALWLSLTGMLLEVLNGSGMILACTWSSNNFHCWPILWYTKLFFKEVQFKHSTEPTSVREFKTAKLCLFQPPCSQTSLDWHWCNFLPVYNKRKCLKYGAVKSVRNIFSGIGKSSLQLSIWEGNHRWKKRWE